MSGDFSGHSSTPQSSDNRQPADVTCFAVPSRPLDPLVPIKCVVAGAVAVVVSVNVTVNVDDVSVVGGVSLSVERSIKVEGHAGCGDMLWGGGTRLGYAKFQKGGTVMSLYI